VGGRGRGTIAARSCAVGVAAAVARVHFEFCGYGGVSDQAVVLLKSGRTGIVVRSILPSSGVTPVHCNSGVHRANDSAQCCLHPGFLCGNLLANNTAGARPRPSCENVFVCRGMCAVGVL